MYKYLEALRKLETGGNLVSRMQIRHLKNDNLLHIAKEGKANLVQDPRDLNNPQISMNFGKGKNTPQHTLLSLNPNSPDGNDYKGIEPSSFDEVVAHEIQHQYDRSIGNRIDDTGNRNQDNPIEIRGVYSENIQRNLNGKKPRTRYGKKIDKNLLVHPPNFKRP